MATIELKGHVSTIRDYRSDSPTFDTQVPFIHSISAKGNHTQRFNIVCYQQDANKNRIDDMVLEVMYWGKDASPFIETGKEIVIKGRLTSKTIVSKNGGRDFQTFSVITNDIQLSDWEKNRQPQQYANNGSFAQQTSSLLDDANIPF